MVAFCCIVLTGGWILGRYAMTMALPFPDTHTYLEVGRNWMEGRGFVTRFNVVFGWSGTLSHPALAYYNPLSGILLGMLWKLSTSFGIFAVATTVIPAAVNALLLGIIVGRSAGHGPGLVTAAAYFGLPSSIVNVSTVGLEHLMVTICLVLVWLLIDRDRTKIWPWLFAGFVIGVGCLIKVTVVAAYAAVVIGLVVTRSGSIKERIVAAFRPSFLCLAGLAAVLVPFQIACISSVGSIYPEYPHMAKLWGLGKLYGGEIIQASPAVRPYLHQLPSIGQWVLNVLDNFRQLGKVLALDLGLLGLPLLALPLFWSRTSEAEKYLFLLGGVFGILYAVAYYWYPFSVDLFSPLRYILHTSVFWLPVSVAALWRLTERIVAHRVWMTALATGLCLVGMVPLFVGLWHIQRSASQFPEPLVAAAERAMKAIQEITSPDDLVAIQGGSQEICMSLFVERPIVALPENAMNTVENLRRLTEIYRPYLVVPGSQSPLWYVMPQLGYVPVRVPFLAPAFGYDIVFIRAQQTPVK